MKRVYVTVNGREFHLACKAGEEAYLQELAAELDRRAVALADKGDPIGETQTMLILALSLLDELQENNKKSNAKEMRQDKTMSDEITTPLKDLTERIEKLATSANLGYKESA